MKSSRNSGRAFQVAAVMLWFGSIAAQVPVDFNPSVVNLQTGESALIAIEVTGISAQGLAAMQLEFSFDPMPIDLLNPNEAFRGTVDPFAPLGNDPLCTTVRGTPTCEDPDWFLTSTGRTPLGSDTIDNPNGIVVVAYATHGAPALPTGDGAIALIEVYGAYNGTVTVNLSEMILADNQEPPGTFATTPGSLMVVVGTGIANQPPVLAAIGSQSVYEELALSIPLSATDPDGNGLAFSALGLPAFCALVDAGNGTGSINCTPSAGDAATYPVTVTVTDDGGPNLSDSESFGIVVDPTNCIDGDDDGFGSPGDPSCPAGDQTDCNDADPNIYPGTVELCRNGVDDDCNDLSDIADAICPAPVCILVALGAPASDPVIDFQASALCPTPGVLARPIDLIWGNLADVRIDTGQVKSGAANQVVCSDTADAQAFDSLRPDPGVVDYFLARETGVADYGDGSGSLPRTPDSGGCP